MNKKITVRLSDGRVRCCILAGDRDLQDQLNEWYFGAALPSGGSKLWFSPTEITVRDSIAYETVTTFPILAIEDTEAPPCLDWIDPKTI